MNRIPALLAAVLVSLSAAPASTATTWTVVRADGAHVVARTRPLIAMGAVSFLDGAGRRTVLPATDVDVAATRRLLDPAPRGIVWDAAALERVAGTVQFAQAGLGADVDPAGASGPGDPEEAAGEAPVAGDPRTTQLRQQIETIQDQLTDLPAEDRRTTLLVTRQRELQAELERLQDVPTAAPR